MNGLHHQVLVESNLKWLALILIMDNTCLQIHKVALCWLIILLKPFSFLVSQRKKRKRKKGEPWNLHFVSFCFPPVFSYFPNCHHFPDYYYHYHAAPLLIISIHGYEKSREVMTEVKTSMIYIFPRTMQSLLHSFHSDIWRCVVLGNDDLDV